MRATACALEQALAPSAASAVKQSVLLARRRGHSQVTPLHVANTLLAAAEGSFRSACLRSHSHPLQCKALELCFNVALNRLPTTLASHHTPAISNALVAAFKRGQAHGRRGSAEAHLLAAKIDLDQLVISILDDPSVSRVMKEAGFSSTQVKANLEAEVETPVSVSLSPPPPPNKISNTTIKSDVSIVIQALLVGRKRRSLVLVGECVSALENIVKSLMDKVDNRKVPEELREIKLVTIPPLYTFCNLGREEVEHKVSELTSLVKSVLAKGVILYLGDFKWISDYRVCLEKEERRYYCSVEHAIMEIGKLVWGIGETEKFWLMGIATFPTYLKCKNSSLENVWGLHPVTIPANNFGLWKRHDETGGRNGELNLNLSCCFDCSAKFEEEARDLRRNLGPTLSELPSWLEEESRRLNNQNQTSEAAIKKACMKWNSFCSSAHKHYAPLDKTPTESNNFFSFNQQLKDNNQHWTRNLLRMQEIEGNAFSSTTTTSSSEATDIGYAQKLSEFSAENLNILCNGLEKKFPCYKEIIPEIAGTILQCRSGMLKRKDQERGNTAKQETWLSFVGPDPSQVKEKISKELAKVVFGSHANFLSIGLSSTFTVSSKPSNADCRNKRVRDEENSRSYFERFCEAVSENPHRVFFLEDLEQVDHCSRVGIRRAIEEGKIRNGNGDEIGFFDAVVVLSYESPKFGECNMREEGKSVCVPLDLNVSFEGVDDGVVDEFGYFENVDRRVVFRVHDL